MSTESTSSMAIPTRVLVVGGSYAGLAVALNLLDLCNGQQPRFSGANSSMDASQRAPIEITIVDERDGFCTPFPDFPACKRLKTYFG